MMEIRTRAPGYLLKGREETLITRVGTRKRVNAGLKKIMIVKPLTRYLLQGLFLIVPFFMKAQSETAIKRNWADSINQLLYTDPNIDSKTKLSLADSAAQIFNKQRDTCNQIFSRILEARYLDRIGKPDSALVQLYWASKFYRQRCDSLTLMFLFSNLINVYLSLGEFNRVDSVGRIALSSWNPSWKKKDSRFSILNNLAIAQASTGDVNKATSTFHQAYDEAVLDNFAKYEQKALINLGSIKGMTKDLDSAYFFFSKAANIALKNVDKYEYMTLLTNLANLDKERGRYKEAIVTLDSTYAMADRLKNVEILANVQNARADLYAKMKDFEKAYDFLRKYIKTHEQFLNEERVKAVTEMMEKYESEKKARQIQQLQLDKLDASLKTERITNTRNHYLYLGLVVFLIAVGSLGRLRYVHRSRSAIQREKDISEGLLLNILPSAVAEELKLKGHAEAKHYDLATILFSDFKSFTTISERLSAKDLVEEINFCFKAFDGIMTRYGIEKIKTIGDSYMAAGAIPDMNTASPLDVVMAAIEMQQVITNRKKERDEQQQPAFEMRVGIHSGPVVAGIVGVKKFQYDIWGDTVNTASRMESSSEVGQVNISDATYQLIKDNPQLVFTYRGKVQAKGKGEMPMYFVTLAA
ncbi:MAG: tetratricopeptide repeat protein [Saprospiraceae bacterium]|uniref:Tetratricopeptide repeat protein n=1 Tax=Candidatus Opimibacter skivensis TaxID=2982028 RepID=A0A9D7SVV9_9BACT|nr:tetratricopeptide repeat protein [Candidatus Opimibacter skivensis]